MRTKRTKRNRRKRSRRKIKRGGWLPGVVGESIRNVAYQFGNTFNEMGGKYQTVNPSPLSQPLLNLNK